ncbi:MAG: hypothetical protein AVDCRST_MAG95-1152 [uncultured Adhaeribacter sp.]|uniref:Uncharacterized protein n=1 Tax=uncultured Adhaeribacter sp. TaxID=448109 RepID=A0A6J4HY68_9BACT|nr:MAG: hypothetical protein AVDCRST_MAG95-1152 [uncultured Adhaeribacter sp.]
MFYTNTAFCDSKIPTSWKRRSIFYLAAWFRSFRNCKVYF